MGTRIKVGRCVETLLILGVVDLALNKLLSTVSIHTKQRARGSPKCRRVNCPINNYLGTLRNSNLSGHLQLPGSSALPTCKCYPDRCSHSVCSRCSAHVFIAISSLGEIARWKNNARVAIIYSFNGSHYLQLKGEWGSKRLQIRTLGCWARN